MAFNINSKLNGVSPYTTDDLAEGSTNKFFTEVRTMNSKLVGLTPSAPGGVTSDDTLISAIAKFIANLFVINQNIDGKEPTVATGTTTQYWRGDKTWQTLNKAAVGLANADNTSDLLKPVSNATATALAAKEATIAAGTTAQYWRGDKSWQTLNKAAVGLGNVDNTSDALKPLSNAEVSALAGKANVDLKNLANLFDTPYGGSLNDLPMLYNGRSTVYCGSTIDGPFTGDDCICKTECLIANGKAYGTQTVIQWRLDMSWTRPISASVPGAWHINSVEDRIGAATANALAAKANQVSTFYDRGAANTNVNWNTLLAPGSYQMYGSETGANGPAADMYKYGSLNVYVGGITVVQEYLPSNATGKTYRRTSYDGGVGFAPWTVADAIQTTTFDTKLNKDGSNYNFLRDNPLTDAHSFSRATGVRHYFLTGAAANRPPIPAGNDGPMTAYVYDNVTPYAYIEFFDWRTGFKWTQTQTADVWSDWRQERNDVAQDISGQDLNNLFRIGEYSGSSLGNAPNGWDDHCYVEIFGGFPANSGYRAQRATLFGTTNHGVNITYQRVMLNGAWTPWKLFADYEEGSFTPLIAGSDGGTKTVAALNKGWWTRTGKTVTAGGRLSWSGTEALTGYTLLKGLPFPSRNEAGAPSVGLIGYIVPGSMSLGSGFASLSLVLDPNSTAAFISQNGPQGSDVTPGVATTGSLYFEITYRID